MSNIKFIRLSSLSVTDGEPAMHWPAVVAYVEGTRRDPRPVEVVPLEGVPGRYRITNGRHRYVSALLRGDSHVRCRVHPPNV